MLLPVYPILLSRCCDVFLLPRSCGFEWTRRFGQARRGYLDSVLDALVGAPPLHGFIDRTDEVVADPEGLGQVLPGHGVDQLLHHEGAVGVALPAAVGLDEETLGRFGLHRSPFSC